jgi:hypothetical protein
MWRGSRATARCGPTDPNEKVRKDDIVMNIKRNALLAIMGLVMAGAGVSSASAATTLHPRRAEVNERLAHQNYRIAEERRDGEINAREASRLHRADYRVRRQEVRFAHFHKGHISRVEQGRLNHEENRASRHIG